MYPNLAGKTSSHVAMIRTKTVITDIPIPVILHNFFSSYLTFSSLPAVLYPAIKPAP